MKTSDFWLLVRGYVSEIVLSGIVLAVAVWLLPGSGISDLLHPISGRLAILTGGLMAASFGIMGVYFSQTSSDFGKYLSWNGVSTAYLAAFGVAGIYHVITTVFLVFLSTQEGEVLALLCTFMLSLSLINVVSLVGNLVAIVKLRDLFNRELSANDR